MVSIAAQRLHDITNNVAEARAALLAIQVGSKLKVTRIHIEGDSQIIANAIKNGKAKALRLESIIVEINNILHTFRDFKISHIRCKVIWKLMLFQNGPLIWRKKMRYILKTLD